MSASENIQVKLFLRSYNEKDELSQINRPLIDLQFDGFAEKSWIVPSTGGQPITEIGVAYAGERPVKVYVDRLDWKGAPNVTLTRQGEVEHPWDPPFVWRRAWVNGLDLWEPWCLNHTG